MLFLCFGEDIFIILKVFADWTNRHTTK